MKKKLKVSIPIFFVLIYFTYIFIQYISLKWLKPSDNLFWIEQLGNKTIYLSVKDSREFSQLLNIKKWNLIINTKKDSPSIYFGIKDINSYCGILIDRNIIVVDGKYYSLPKKDFANIIKFISEKLNNN